MFYITKYLRVILLNKEAEMEQYIYLSVMFFSLIIFFLYIYIIYEKLIENYKSKRVKKYSFELEPYVDHIISEIINGEDIKFSELDNLKTICKNKIRREVIENRLLYYFENFKREFKHKLIELCEYIGIIEYEIKNLNNRDNFRKALAAKRLGDFRSKKSISALLQEINITNNDVKYNILLALAKIGEEEAFIKAFRNIDSVVILSERSLIEIIDSFEGDKNKIYKYMINSSNNFIASVFIKSAGNYKNVLLNNEISKYLFSGDKELKIASVKAIGSIGDEKYLDVIIKLLEDSEWEVRAVTARALGSFNNVKILMPLVKALSDSQWYVRFNAATSILNHSEGVKVVSHVFQGEDRFAKDIIISAVENSPKNILYLYENSDDPEKRILAAKLGGYIKEYSKNK